MKNLKITLTIVFFGFLMRCQKDTLFDSDKKETRRIENSNQLTGTWSLVNVSGGFAGVDYNFPPSMIKWTFNEVTNQLEVANNNLFQGVFIHDGLPTGNYSFFTNTVLSRCQTNFQSIDIENLSEACFTISNDVLFIDANLGADGFQYKLVRNVECGTSSNYLVFGHFYGFCAGETCIEKFKLTSDKIFENTNDVYPGTNTSAQPNYVQLSNEKFLATQDLMSFFPNSLLSETNTTIGMPDASDGGGLYIEYHFNSVHKTFLIDQFKINVPSTYHVFMDKVNEKIALMQQ